MYVNKNRGHKNQRPHLFRALVAYNLFRHYKIKTRVKMKDGFAHWRHIP